MSEAQTPPPFGPKRSVLVPGLIHCPGFLDGEARTRLAAELHALVAAAPPYTPRMPRTDRPFSVRMTNGGALGWVSDRTGYRYQAHHPVTGAAWPPMPATARTAWDVLCPGQPEPQACLVNLYGPEARMGLHQDRDEEDLSVPVLSLSLGADAVFRYGGLRRGDPTRSVRLRCGDALVIGGDARLIHHGIDRILPHSSGRLDAEGGVDLSPFLPAGGRCNLTVRRVTRTASA